MDDFSYPIIFLSVFFSFFLLYFGSAMMMLFFSTKLLPFYRVGHVIDTKPLKLKQEWTEIKYSLLSIFIFAIYGCFIKFSLDSGFISINWAFSWFLLAVEVFVLFIWNELHFYLCHRLLHLKWVYTRVHVIHHHSIRPTPFSTYSFHWFEAVLLGSVMIIAMLFYDFMPLALVSLPLMSIILNALGHSNYDIVPSRKLNDIFAFSRRHSLHHSTNRGNFGFLLPIFDQLFHTEIKEKKEKK